MNQKKIKEVTASHFNSTAEDYDNSNDGRFVNCMYQEIVNRARGIPEGRILDLGCGNGNVIALLRNKVHAAYYGLDISEKMIEEAKKRLQEEVLLSVGDAEQLPYKDHFFDLIICNASFHHYPRPEIALAEMKRVLRQNGVIILGDPTLPTKFFTNILNWFIKYSHSGDVKIWHKKEIIDLFEKNGFQIENWKKINYKTFMFNAVNNQI